MKRVLSSTLIALIAVALVAPSIAAKPRHRSAKSVWIGASVQSVDRDLAEAFDLAVAYGVIINDVVADAPADEAGLEEDDIIIAFNGAKVYDEEELRDLLSERRRGDEITLTVMRGDDEKDFAVVVENRSPAPLADIARLRPRSRSPLSPKHYSYRYSSDSKSYIGVSMIDVTEQLGAFFGASDGDGVLISEVEEDSPADKAGLKVGDLIVEIKGEAVRRSGDVQEVIHDSEAGDEVEVIVLREKKRTPLTVEVGETDSPRYGFLPPISLPDLDVFSIPDLPKVNGLRWGTGSGRWFDSDEYREDMDELRKDLRELKKELEELRRSRR